MSDRTKYNPDGTLDEIVRKGWTIHAEDMGDNWAIILDSPDGKHTECYYAENFHLGWEDHDD